MVLTPRTQVCHRWRMSPRKNTCVRGHDLNDPDVAPIDKNGRRQCRLCVNAVRRERRGNSGPKFAYNRNRVIGVDPKYCSGCETMKSESEFSKQESARDGLQNRCKDCGASNPKNPLWRQEHPEQAREHRQAYNRKRKYGLSRDDYQGLLESQGGACAICPKLPAESVHGVLVVDHDHATGAVRGLLCHPCNVGLSRFQDDPQLLRAALDYLQKSEGRVEQ